MSIFANTLSCIRGMSARIWKFEIFIFLNIFKKMSKRATAVLTPVPLVDPLVERVS